MFGHLNKSGIYSRMDCKFPLVQRPVSFIFTEKLPHPTRLTDACVMKQLTLSILRDLGSGEPHGYQPHGYSRL